MDDLDQEFFARDTLTVARELLGVKLIYKECAGIIVETEAYRDDEASHAVTRPKTGGMLRTTYGQVYIYLVYGMYHCLNFTTEKHGVGAVLVRAVEPVAGLSKMHERRKPARGKNLTNGPGKLFQAFGLQPVHHGEVVGRSIRLVVVPNNGRPDIATSPRIGISKAKELEWRFFIKGNPYVSKP
ncbi:MAG: DNA-3-methyladenine glycosylase [bacterium]